MQHTDKVSGISRTPKINERVAKVRGEIARLTEIHWHIKKVKQAFVAGISQILYQGRLTQVSLQIRQHDCGPLLMLDT